MLYRLKACYVHVVVSLSVGLYTAPGVSSADKSVHRLEMANFLHTFNHDGICGPSLLRVGMLAHPLSLSLSPQLELQYVAPSIPSPARLARYSYVYSNQPPLSPFLWSHHLAYVAVSCLCHCIHCSLETLHTCIHTFVIYNAQNGYNALYSTV